MTNIKRNKKKGFTLIELIVVIAILAIIAALAIPSFNSLKDSSAKQVAESNARSVYTAGMAAEAVAADGTNTAIQAEFNKLVETMKGTGITVEWDSTKDVATWEGPINGKNWKATCAASGTNIVE